MAKDKAKTKTKVKTKAKAAAKERAPRVNSLSHFIREELGDGAEPEAIVKAAAKKFPDRKVSLGLVNWIAQGSKAAGKRKQVAA